MNYWFVQHNIQAYRNHKDMIGQKYKGKISKIKKGDKIVYYITGDMEIVGTFRVTSNISQLKKDKHWGNNWIYKIKPIRLGKGHYFLPLKEVLSKTKLRLFPQGKIKGIKLKGRTAIEISKKDFDKIGPLIGKNAHPKEDQFTGTSNEEGLGELEELEIMRHTPTNEAGVIVLFAHYMEKLGFPKFEFIRTGFPDACVLERKDKRLQRKYIEFEFKSSSFRRHVDNPKHVKIKCDYVVCWKNDYLQCPIEVIELKSRIEKIKESKKN